MKKYIKHIVGITLIASTLVLTSCGSSSSASRNSRNVNHYQHGGMRTWGNLHYYERDVIIIDDIDSDYDIGVPEAEVLPELWN